MINKPFAMKRKFIYLTVVFVVFLVSAVFLTAHHYKREYKIDFYGKQSCMEVTGFNVLPQDNLTLSMFDNSFDVYVTIDADIKSRDLEMFVSYVQKNESIQYVDGSSAVVVEFVPVISDNMFSRSFEEHCNHTERFKYTLKGYNSSIKKYIFRCGDFEEVISFYSGK